MDYSNDVHQSRDATNWPSSGNLLLAWKRPQRRLKKVHCGGMQKETTRGEQGLSPIAQSLYSLQIVTWHHFTASLTSQQRQTKYKRKSRIVCDEHMFCRQYHHKGHLFRRMCRPKSADQVIVLSDSAKSSCAYAIKIFIFRFIVHTTWVFLVHLESHQMVSSEKGPVLDERPYWTIPVSTV